MIKKILEGLKNPRLILLYILSFKIFRTIPDELFLKVAYKLRLGKKLNLENPRTFNEKLQWLKLYNRNPLYTNLVDKYEVRKFIAQTIGEEYLIPLVGVWDRFNDIDFDKLPNQFVLKCTHDSGGIVICTDKSKFNIKTARKKITKCLRRNFYYLGREWPYKDVKPRIICEKYMVDESGVELKDYKVFCFDGEPKLIQVDFNRHINHKRNLYDINWNLMNFEFKYPCDINYPIQKPNTLREMLEIATVISRSIPYIRVDFYSIHDKLYIGELTFFPESGFGKFDPESYDDLLGSWVKLPKPI